MVTYTLKNDIISQYNLPIFPEDLKFGSIIRGNTGSTISGDPCQAQTDNYSITLSFMNNIAAAPAGYINAEI